MKSTSIFLYLLLSFSFLNGCTPIKNAKTETMDWKQFIGKHRLEVEAVYGKADKDDDLDDTEGEIVFLEYYKEGFQLTYNRKAHTIEAIFFYNKANNYEEFSTFENEIIKGITWESTLEEVIGLYGEPIDLFESERHGQRVIYDGFDFRFVNGVLVRISYFSS